jgi:hypothetical protein
MSFKCIRISPNQFAFDSTAELSGEIPDGPEAITDAKRVDSPLVASDLINEDGTRQRESAPFAALSDLMRDWARTGTTRLLGRPGSYGDEPIELEATWVTRCPAGSTSALGSPASLERGCVGLAEARIGSTSFVGGCRKEKQQ